MPFPAPFPPLPPLFLSPLAPRVSRVVPVPAGVSLSSCGVTGARLLCERWPEFPERPGTLTQRHFAANDSRMLLRVGYGRYGYHPVDRRAPEVRA